MRDNIKRMRPMGIADILDETVEIYKTSFLTLMGISAVLYVPYSIFNGWFMMRYFPRLDFRSPTPQFDLLPFFGAIAVGLLYTLIVTPFVTGAMTFAISEKYLGNQTSIGASFARVLRPGVFFRMLLSILITIVLMVAAWVLIVVMIAGCVLVAAWNVNFLFAAIPIAVLLSLGALAGAIYLLLRLALIQCVIVVELKHFVASVVRAWGLMRGSMLKCLLLIVLAYLVTAIVQSMVQQPTSMMMSTSMLKGGQPSSVILVLHTIISAVSSTLLAPIMSIVTIMLYYDIRIRKEGFDLELLAAELHANAKQATMWAAQPLPQEQVTTVTQEIPPPVDPTQP